MERRIAALDGMRGIAVGLVLLRHMFAVAGSWAGVDIFFVLSGYLITSILRAERNEPQFWRIFYLRRVTRILPAYLVLILATVLFLDLPWRILWPYYTFFAANIASITFTDQAMGPLVVLWSLAVEEHFYFLWPANVRRFSDRTLAFLLIGIALAEPVVRVLYLHINPDWHIYYYLTPFHLDGLVLGGLVSIALSFPGARRVLHRLFGGFFFLSATACLIVFGFFHISRESNPWMFNAVAYSLIAITGACALGWLIVQPQTWFSKLLSLPPFVFLGRISYGLYLYHLFVMVFVQRVAQHYGQTHYYRNNIAALPISILVAWLSFRYFESPILALSKRLVGEYRSTGKLARVAA